LDQTAGRGRAVEGILVGYLPGLSMPRIADLHQGEAKTDARDAGIIAQAARSMPHALRSIQVADEQVSAHGRIRTGAPPRLRLLLRMGRDSFQRATSQACGRSRLECVRSPHRAQRHAGCAGSCSGPAPQQWSFGRDELQQHFDSPLDVVVHGFVARCVRRVEQHPIL
jgi:Transposase